MEYKKLKEIQESWGGKVCLFGAGLIGCTWGFDLLTAIGFDINFYCDNNKRSGLIIREEIRIIPIEELFSLKDNVLVFITAGGSYQEKIISQLNGGGITNIIGVDYLFLQEFLTSLKKINDKAIEEQFACILDDREYISRRFEYRMGYRPDLDNPQTFNEKIQWLKLHNRNPQYTHMVDKYEAKEFVANKIGEEYIIPTLGVYNFFDEIDFSQLPSQFVLKCTHDCGSTMICKDKDKLDKKKMKKNYESMLRRNFYWGGREWAYKNVKPQIIAEQYLSDGTNIDIWDYKIFTFNGIAKLIQVDYDRFGNHRRNLYTIDWQYIEASIQFPNDSKVQIDRPKALSKMIEIAEQLSAGIPHVRVDLYLVSGKIYFGELTFYHGSGYEIFKPAELEYKLGEMIQL